MNESLFNEFVPCPIEKEDDSDWYYENWGTDGEAVFDLPEDAGEIDILKLYFETAWCPPIEFFKHMYTLGFKVIASYNEPGAGIIGKFRNGKDIFQEYFEDDLKNYTKVLAGFEELVQHFAELAKD